MKARWQDRGELAQALLFQQPQKRFLGPQLVSPIFPLHLQSFLLLPGLGSELMDKELEHILLVLSPQGTSKSEQLEQSYL